MGRFGVKDGFVLFSLQFTGTIIATMGSPFSIVGATGLTAKASAKQIAISF